MVLDVEVQPRNGSEDEGVELFHHDTVDAAPTQQSRSLAVALSQSPATYSIILLASIALFLQSPHFRKSIGCSVDLTEDALLLLQRRLTAGASGSASVHVSHREESLRVSVHSRSSVVSSGSAASSAASISSSLTTTSSVQAPTAAHASATDRLEALLSQWLVQMDFLALNRSLSAKSAEAWPRDLLRFLDALPVGIAIADVSATVNGATDDDDDVLCRATVAFCNGEATDCADACYAHWLASTRLAPPPPLPSSSSRRLASVRLPNSLPRCLGDALAVFRPLPPSLTSSQRDEHCRSAVEPAMAQLRRLVARAEAGAVVLATESASVLWIVRPVAASSSPAQSATSSHCSHVLLLQRPLSASAVTIAQATDSGRPRVRLMVRDNALCDDLLALQDVANLLPALCAL